MNFRVTVRYGTKRTRYHLDRIRADDLPDALRRLADRLPEEVAAEGDLVELRPDIDPEAREYLDE